MFDMMSVYLLMNYLIMQILLCYNFIVCEILTLNNDLTLDYLTSNQTRFTRSNSSRTNCLSTISLHYDGCGNISRKISSIGFNISSSSIKISTTVNNFMSTSSEIPATNRSYDETIMKSCNEFVDDWDKLNAIVNRSEEYITTVVTTALKTERTESMLERFLNPMRNSSIIKDISKRLYDLNLGNFSDHRVTTNDSNDISLNAWDANQHAALIKFDGNNTSTCNLIQSDKLIDKSTTVIYVITTSEVNNITVGNITEVTTNSNLNKTTTLEGIATGNTTFCITTGGSSTLLTSTAVSWYLENEQLENEELTTQINNEMADGETIMMTRPPIQFLIDHNLQIKNITKLFMDEHSYFNITSGTIHTNGTMIDAAGRFVTDCFEQMSKVMHCFSGADLPEPTLTNITFHLFTRNNLNISEVLAFNTEMLDNYEEDTGVRIDKGEGDYGLTDYSDDDYDEEGDNASEEGSNLFYYGDDYSANYIYEDDSYRPRLMRRNIEEDFGYFDMSNSSVPSSTKKNVSQNVVLSDYSSNKSSSIHFKQLFSGRCLVPSKYFNVWDKTKIIIHGYTQSHTTEPILQLKDAYLSQGSFNIILVDWAELAAGPCYNFASKYARSVGGLVSELVDQLIMCGMNRQTVHIIGFSLGAQAAGYAGSYFSTGHISRITGLDPAFPLFPSRDPEDCLDPGDAHFVDIIHTSHILGQRTPLGHADFYPNGGSRQPGCDKSDFICSHIRGLLLFTESVTSVESFPAVLCDSWETFMNGGCDKEPVSLMGDSCSTKINGLYYLKTNTTTPYSLSGNFSTSFHETQ